MPVFRRDVLWYGDVRPSVRPCLRPSVTVFRHFSPTCFEILSWNFVYHFIMMHVRASSNAINFCQFLMELCPFLNFKLLQICSFPHFSPHALTFRAEILHMTFFLLYYRTSSSVVNFRQFLLELCPFWNLEYWKYTVFRTFLLHALTYWAEISRLTLFYCTTDQVPVLSIFVGVMPLLERRNTRIHSFPHFSLTRFDIFSWNFAFDFVLTVLQIKFQCCQFPSIFVGVMPFWNVEY